LGSAHTPDDVRSTGTKNVINAMHIHGVPRLIVQSSYGVGETNGLLDCTDQLFFKLLLKPQIADTEQQEQIVKNSGIEWVLAQPVHLTDSQNSTAPFTKYPLNKPSCTLQALPIKRCPWLNCYFKCSVDNTRIRTHKVFYVTKFGSCNNIFALTIRDCATG